MHFQENFNAAKLGHLYMHDVIKRGAIKYKITCLNYSHFLIFQFLCVCMVKTFCCNYPI